MNEIKGQMKDINILLVTVYSRLKNLIYDDIPKIYWETKYEIPKKMPHEKFLNFEPE